MARTAVAVVQPGTSGATVAATALDSVNQMTVPGYTNGMRLVIANSGGSPINVTFVQKVCPTCGIATNDVVAVAAGGIVVVSGLRNDLFQQADGSLSVNPSASTGTIYALPPQ